MVYRQWLMFMLLGWSLLLQAEVQEVVIRWDAATCLDVCIPLFENNLKSIKAVKSVQLNARAGLGIITWDPNAEFSYEPFNLASRGSGVRMTDFRVRVKGTVVHDQDNFYVASIGDGTRFQIIGPLASVPGRYMIDANVANHPVPGNMQAELLDAQQDGRPVTVEGPLFLPTTYYLTIVGDTVKVAPKNTDQRYQY